MIPVFLQVLPLLSGVMYAVEEIPEKWQWILSLNPMTAVISGWRWAVRRRQRARSGARSRSASPSPSALFVVGGSACSGRPSRASRTRSDGGRDRSRGALQAVPARRVPGRLRDAPRVARPCRKAAHAARSTGARRRRSGRSRTSPSTSPEGEVLGVDRPQRRRQVDAAQGAHADHDAHGGPRRDPRPRREPARGRHGLPSRAHRPREHLPERRDPRDEAARDPGEAPGDRRVLGRRVASSTRP